jgi:hypothetical protein
MQPELERLFARLIASPEIDASDPVAIGTFLAASELEEGDRRALSADFSKLWVYRQLVRGSLREALELAIPRSMARLGALFDEYFERFLAEAGPRSPYLRDVTTEFLSFTGPLWQADERVPPWTLDLARHEALRISVGAMPSSATVPGTNEELALDRGILFTEACTLVRYDFAVHRLSDDEADRSEPSREPTMLFVYRSPEHEVRYLELSALAFGILRRLLDGAPLERAIAGAASEGGVSLDQGVLEGTARLLADLAERGALLGPGAARKDARDVTNPAPPARP